MTVTTDRRPANPFSGNGNARQGSNGQGTAFAETLHRLEKLDAPDALKPPVDREHYAHRQFIDGVFWKHIPAYRDISESEFLDYGFQTQHSITKLSDLIATVRDLAPSSFLEDVERGLELAPMHIRLSPYIVSLINWEEPYEDPLRIQFLPVASTREPDHPMLSLDSLDEQGDAPTGGLVHRYQDKVLFLALDVCPVYCRFCTRSYAVGSDTDSVSKVNYRPIQSKWDTAFAYLLSRPEVEDVVISGGDAYFLPANRLEYIVDTLLAIPHIRRIRIASKGPAVMPMRLLPDNDWSDTVIDLAIRGRNMGKEVCLHTHFNHPNEITDITRRAMARLYAEGVRIRNQSVMIRGVNDSTEDMSRLVKKLGYINVQPYYVYQHDLVTGVDELRTRLKTTLEIERNIRGITAGFNTPTFVTDAPGGGGKRGVHSYDFYDEETGISVYRSPSVDDGRVHLYFDPVSLLPETGQSRWEDASQHRKMIDEALNSSSLSHLEIAN